MKRHAALFVLFGIWSAGIVQGFAGELSGGRLTKNADSEQGTADSASFLQRWFLRRDGRWEPYWSVYDVREGDIVFFQCKSRLWQAAFSTFGSPGPTHVAIVVRMDDGELGLLQATDPQLKVKPTLEHPGYKPGHVCLSVSGCDRLSQEVRGADLGASASWPAASSLFAAAHRMGTATSR